VVLEIEGEREKREDSSSVDQGFELMSLAIDLAVLDLFEDFLGSLTLSASSCSPLKDE
jgi:hypothetical protein